MAKNLAQVDGHPVTALIHTGPTVTLVHPSLLMDRVIQTTQVPLTTVTGERAPIVGHCEVTIQEHCLLGMDFLRAVGAVTDLGAVCVKLLDSVTVPLCFSSTPLGPIVCSRQSWEIHSVPLG